ncbi:MAG TPA: hypothetical protein VGK04_11995 [Thermoanaerobaculia bacterium]|jgi:hypothetical protein
MRDTLLFSGEDARDALAEKIAMMKKAIESYDPNRLLNSNVDDLVTYFASVAEVEPIEILDDQIGVDQSEAQVDVSNRFEYAPWDRGTGPRHVTGFRVSLRVPFRGDGSFFKCKPSTFTYSPPSGDVRGNEVVLSFAGPQGDAGRAKQELDGELANVRKYLTWLTGDMTAHNRSLVGIARSTVEERRHRLLHNQSVAATLGYPLRSRSDAPRTFAVPDVRRKAVPTPPATSNAPFVPEPTLDDATYEHILTVLANMVRVMEQSPGAFANMNEEDLRTHFLVQLNGQFEGRASAETFRGSGSTDILLVEKDKSVFVAECKFWKGPESLVTAVDQLLDYATWRDAKAAILVFSRNRDFSGVVGSVPEVLRAHPQTAGAVTSLSVGAFRSRLRQRDDASRHIVLTTLVYNVPAERTESKRLTSRRKMKAPAK